MSFTELRQDDKGINLFANERKQANINNDYYWNKAC